MVRILVPIKRVPDYEAQIRVREDGSGIVADGIKWIVNPFDEIAVEEALRIRESRNDVDEVVVVSVGQAAAVEQLRAMMSIGADRAILVSTEGELDSFAVHKLLSRVVKREEPALILMGKQSIDSDACQTGQLLAASLGIAQATFASKIVISENLKYAQVTREVDGGLETISVVLPAVITTDLRLNEPRYASIKGVIQAKKKPLQQITPKDLGVEVEPRVRVISMEQSPKRKTGIKVSSIPELLSKLKSELKTLNKGGL